METELDKKAHEYALKNASRFINKTLAEAYIAGYKAGFKDCEDNILISLPKKDIEYVDLGLPSGTLWSSDYCLIDNDFDIMAFCNKESYKSYQNVDNLSLPTEEQWQELITICKWEFSTHEYIKNQRSYWPIKCVGPNGIVIRFDSTGCIKSDTLTNVHKTYFWLKNKNNNFDKQVAYIDCKNHNFSKTTTLFCGYKLPVRLVK